MTVRLGWLGGDIPKMMVIVSYSYFVILWAEDVMPANRFWRSLLVPLRIGTELVSRPFSGQMALGSFESKQTTSNTWAHELIILSSFKSRSMNI